MFALLLEHASHLVTSAASGREAIALLRAQRFDLILTDIIMPEVDGLEVIQAAKALQPHARLVAMTGGSMHMGASYCARLAAALDGKPVLLKPFGAQELMAAIDHETSSDPVMASCYGVAPVSDRTCEEPGTLLTA